MPDGILREQIILEDSNWSKFDENLSKNAWESQLWKRKKLPYPGFEPATFSLLCRDSTTELLGQLHLSPEILNLSR